MTTWVLENSPLERFRSVRQPLMTKSDNITILHGVGNIRTLTGEDIKMVPGQVYDFEILDGVFKQIDVLGQP